MRPRPLRWRGKEPPSRLYLENRVSLCQLQYTSVVSLQEISDWLCYLVSYLTWNSKKYIFRSLSLQKLKKWWQGQAKTWGRWLPGWSSRSLTARWWKILIEDECEAFTWKGIKVKPSLEEKNKVNPSLKKETKSSLNSSRRPVGVCLPLFTQNCWQLTLQMGNS